MQVIKLVLLLQEVLLLHILTGRLTFTPPVNLKAPHLSHMFGYQCSSLCVLCLLLFFLRASGFKNTPNLPLNVCDFSDFGHVLKGRRVTNNGTEIYAYRYFQMSLISKCAPFRNRHRSPPPEPQWQGVFLPDWLQELLDIHSETGCRSLQLLSSRQGKK